MGRDKCIIFCLLFLTLAWIPVSSPVFIISIIQYTSGDVYLDMLPRKKRRQEISKRVYFGFPVYV